MVLTEREFEEILALGYERRGTEFKGPGPRTDKHHFAKITRAVLGMANRRDGGLVIIGVEDNKGTIKPVGLNDSDLGTWNYDDVAVSFAPYADPSVNFDLQKLKYKNNNYIILRVYEFEDIPILCKQDYNSGEKTILRKGACYVRSRHKPETSEIPSQEDMRDLLDLAVDKGVRKWVESTYKSGLFDLIKPVTAGPSDKDLFEAQMADLR